MNAFKEKMLSDRQNYKQIEEECLKKFEDWIECSEEWICDSAEFAIEY